MAADLAANTETLRDGSQVLVRAICRYDAAKERAFIEGLSPQSRRFRFLGSISSPSEALIKQLTELDPSKEVALIALTTDETSPQEVGVARFSIQPDGDAEVAVTVADAWQGKGLATLLMHRLIAAARERGVHRLYSTDAGSNHAMRDLAAHLGFTCAPDPEDRTQVIYSLAL
jgi:RimJ/RimL family protein N-acetyltransferase